MPVDTTLSSFSGEKVYQFFKFKCQFFSRFLAEQGINPSKGLIMNGTQILRLSACGVTIKDSRCFIPGALSAFPKSFGLAELKKGFFPYGFDRPENEAYIGAWPAAKFYFPTKMKPEQKADFDQWHEEQKDKVRPPFSSSILLACSFRFLTCGKRSKPTVSLMSLSCVKEA